MDEMKVRSLDVNLNLKEKNSVQEGTKKDDKLGGVGSGIVRDAVEGRLDHNKGDHCRILSS